MKFYNRTKELNILWEKISSNNFEFIYLLGKRRVWKTTLIEHLNKNILNKDFLYLFIERTDLTVFLKKLETYIYEKTQIKYNFDNIEDFIDFYFKQNEFNLLVIDEFQNFNYIDKSIYSTFQKKIDQYQNKTAKKIIVLWSIQSMMIKIFENINEPLYKRSTFSLFLKEFDLNTQIEILKDIFKESYNHNILLDIYSIFWWIPYYFKSISRLNSTNYNFKNIIKELFFWDFAVLKNEWKEILIEEFWQKYKRFFSILETISSWKNKRNEIMTSIWLWTWEIDIYLKELADIYDIIEVKYPLFENKKNVSSYYIKDNFLNFWFKYVYSNKSKIELWLYDYLIEELSKDFENFKWFKFEKLVQEYLIIQNQRWKLDFIFTKIWTWLDRNNNEIDIIYTDEKENIVFLEVKLNENRINESEKKQLENNVNLFLNKNPIFKDKNTKSGFAIFDEKDLVKFIYL